MMNRLFRRINFVSGPNSAVVLLILAAIGAVLLIVLAGMWAYSNTQKLIASAERVQHTQEVIAALQRVSLLQERMDYRTRLYVLTANEEQLTRAKASANQLETTVVRLRLLVADNPNQVANLQSLSACTGDLVSAVNAFTAKATIPDLAMQRCQQTIGLMSDQEQWLLKDRTKGSERNSFASIATEVVFVILALLGMLVLFGFLMRDAITRQRVARQTAQSNERLALTVNSLEDRATESALLTSARDELQLCVDVAQVYESAAKSLSRLLTGTSGSLCIINNSRQLVETVAQWSSGEDETGVDDFHTPDSCCGLRSGQPRWREPGASEIHCTHFTSSPPERYLCLPIVAHGNTLGVLNVRCATEGRVRWVKEHMDGLRQLVQLTGMAAATLNLRTKLENQSIRDPLTGLFNRHFMQISLERELARAARRKQILAVFMLDLDHFKRFNDTHGHAAGDSVLKAIAEIFKTSIRTEDIACRYGGEEFTIILPDVTPAVAADRAESIRRAVENLRLPLEKDVYGEFTVSVGIALFPDDGGASDLLLRRADQALYRAKRQGRNRVCAFEASLSVM
jgi:diguanylate cyclase (GGDEF)-like protein